MEKKGLEWHRINNQWSFLSTNYYFIVHMESLIFSKTDGHITWLLKQSWHILGPLKTQRPKMPGFLFLDADDDVFVVDGPVTEDQGA